jgi:phosphoribosylformylglycinamidine (FGAM) synthase-like amidotransferase family enzyme
MSDTAVRATILTGHGINADRELGTAFSNAGAVADFLHVNDLIENPGLLDNSDILAFPGGFSFGDHIGSGTILAHIVRNHLRPALEAYLARGKLVIGICNGFQTLAKMGLLPNRDGSWRNEVSLIHNQNGRFIDAWVGLSINRENPSPWLSDLDDFDCPIRHGEGQFIPAPHLGADFPEELIAFRYQTNPNGSFRDIAGITDVSGQVLGMMPHPEAFIRAEQHPRRRENRSAEGLRIFENAVKYSARR